MRKNSIKIYPALIALILGLSLFPALIQPAPAQAQAALPDKVVLANFPIFAQQHYLSCEYSSTRMITAFWGQEIGEQQFIQAIPLNDNPHLGYRGNIDGGFGGTWNYGIYAEPIAKYLETRGFATKLLAGGADALKEELAKGRPVQIFFVVGMGWGNPFTANAKGLNFQLVAGEHSAVVYGYDAQGVYVADPGYGTRNYYSWNSFLRSWAYLGNMGMSVWPQTANLAAVTETNPGISPYFYGHWLNSGGIAILGKPVAPAQTQASKVTQYFERARLEYDLNGLITQPIMAGLLGRELTGNRQKEGPFQPVKPPDSPNIQYFQATGHTLRLGFKGFWENNGGLAVFGYPLSEEFAENGRTIQYFERARFEYFAENPEPYKVQLGLLGVERLNVKLPV